MSESICKCGKKIVWGLLEDGKRVPLDPVPPVYTYNAETEEATRVKFAVIYVNHFATCRFANDFSGTKKS